MEKLHILTAEEMGELQMLVDELYNRPKLVLDVKEEECLLRIADILGLETPND